MNVTFYFSAAVAILATLMVITQRNVMHALLYFIVSLLAGAVIFYTLGAPFAAALEVIIYAGAIMVLFVFVVMLLDIRRSEREEGGLLRARAWIGPAGLAGALLAEILYVLAAPPGGSAARIAVPPRAVGIALYGPYLLAVELAGLLLLAGLVGAYHIGREQHPGESR